MTRRWSSKIGSNELVKEWLEPCCTNHDLSINDPIVNLRVGDAAHRHRDATKTRLNFMQREIDFSLPLAVVIGSIISPAKFV